MRLRLLAFLLAGTLASTLACSGALPDEAVGPQASVLPPGAYTLQMPPNGPPIVGEVSPATGGVLRFFAVLDGQLTARVDGTYADRTTREWTDTLNVTHRETVTREGTYAVTGTVARFTDALGTREAPFTEDQFRLFQGETELVYRKQ
jgi:hypothetical protein